MKEQLLRCLKARKEVIDSDLNKVKLCGREKCNALIVECEKLDTLLKGPYSKGNSKYYGHNNFVKIENVNEIIDKAIDLID